MRCFLSGGGILNVHLLNLHTDRGIITNVSAVSRGEEGSLRSATSLALYESFFLFDTAFLLSMKYEKGSFVLIPNRRHLRLRSLGARAVYTELCSMCDVQGCCFPSRKLLGENILMEEKSVDRFIEELVEAGLLSKTSRRNANGGQTSNLYQIMLLPLPMGVPTPSPSIGLPPVPPMGDELYPVLTQTNERAAEADYEILDEDTKPPKKEGRDKKALSVMKKCYDKLEGVFGVRPTYTFADYLRVLEAQKILKDSAIYDMVDDALSKGKARTLREMLTARAIDIYRQEYA